MAKRHPEWQYVDPQGKPKIAFGAFNWMCLRSPWRERVLDGQLELGYNGAGHHDRIAGTPEDLRAPVKLTSRYGLASA